MCGKMRYLSVVDPGLSDMDLVVPYLYMYLPCPKSYAA